MGLELAVIILPCLTQEASITDVSHHVWLFLFSFFISPLSLFEDVANKQLKDEWQAQGDEKVLVEHR